MASSVGELQQRDVGASQSEAVYTLLNDILGRVLAGEEVSLWVMLSPKGVKKRFYQSHHPFHLSDGRTVLLIEARPEPPAEELLAFATNHSLSIGLYETEGNFVSGNPAFHSLMERNALEGLHCFFEPSPAVEDWEQWLGTNLTKTHTRLLITDRGERYFHGELKRVKTNTGHTRLMLNLTDRTEDRVKKVEDAHRVAAEVALAQKELLLKEVHHRVKNNLQIISSLMRIQASKSPNPEVRDVVQESVYRVRAMALIHEQLYGVDALDRIDLSVYCRKLVSSIQAALAPSASVDFKVSPVFLSLDVAVPVALMLNELITNSFKYGLQNHRTSESDVVVTIGEEDGRVSVEIQDFGPGMAAPTGQVPVGSFGTQLVLMLAQQIRASVQTDYDGGTRVSIRFELKGMERENSLRGRG